ncbi:unnamed protein product [Parnassius apollo]|uniref:(apollo) hypothetical protein n=1 Tax=Parnassius apollo TaxID=110799 RepID=A0A8S3XCK7_PARAO|nr:unnamed protein product [Parnassius apollo]
MHRLFAELEPSVTVTEQNLADRVRYILRSNIFDVTELERLRREAVPSSGENAAAEDAAPQLAEQPANVDAAVNAPVVVDSNDDGTFAQELELEQMRSTLEEAIVETRSTTLENRPRLPRLALSKRNRAVVRALNPMLVTYLEASRDLCETDSILFGAALAVCRIIGAKLSTAGRATGQSSAIPAWRRRIEERIAKARALIGRLICFRSGNTRPRIVRTVRMAFAGTNVSLSQPDIMQKLTERIDDLKQRIAAWGKRIRRYTERSTRFNQNRLFQSDQKRLYKSLERPMVSGTGPAPNQADIVAFWRSLWSEPVNHNEGPWTEVVASQCASITPMDPVIITPDDVAEAVRRAPNWKSPGLDGLHHYWLKGFMVPRQYKIAANIVKKVSTEGGSVKTLLYDNKLRHFVRYCKPRYVRINTNLLTTSDAIRAFQDEGYHFIRCTSGSYTDYLSQIQSLTDNDFTQDYHVKTVFVFAPATKLHEHELYLENKIILQDKATAMAVHLLAPPPGSTVLDMCAAPGMKTTQLAAYMRNEGKIYAVERNEERYQTLCDFVERTGSKCVETLHKDSLDIKRGDYDDVEYILLDPSCSGSGMELSVHNYIEDIRLAKLTSLQEKFLKHAMNSFPKAKRIVYSTCSLFPEENERVITNIVKTSRAKWRVQDVKELLKGQWNNFGSGMYGSIGTRCIYAKPDSDFTTGFFLAVLDRDQKDLEKKKKDENNAINGEEKFTKNVTNGKYISNDSNDDVKTKKIKFYEQTVLHNQTEDENSTTLRYKKKKKKADDNSRDGKYNNGSFKTNVEDIAGKEIIDVNKSNAKKSKKIQQCEISESLKSEETQNSTIVVDESVILDAETSNRQKRKKNKLKVADENCFFDINSDIYVDNKASEEINDENKSNGKKSRKIKHFKISENFEPEETQNSTMDVEESINLDAKTSNRKKKKKNKSKAADDNYFDSRNSDMHVENKASEEINDENESKAKKSKKIKHCDISGDLKPEEIQNSTVNVEESVIMDLETNDRKKKKKRKSKAVDDNVENRSNEEIIDENKNNTKKSKKPDETKNTTINVDELVNVDTDAINKKKKRKKVKEKMGKI